MRNIVVIIITAAEQMFGQLEPVQFLRIDV